MVVVDTTSGEKRRFAPDVFCWLGRAYFLEIVPSQVPTLSPARSASSNQ